MVGLDCFSLKNTFVLCCVVFAAETYTYTDDVCGSWSWRRADWFFQDKGNHSFLETPLLVFHIQPASLFWLLIPFLVSFVLFISYSYYMGMGIGLRNERQAN